MNLIRWVGFNVSTGFRNMVRRISRVNLGGGGPKNVYLVNIKVEETKMAICNKCQFQLRVDELDKHILHQCVKMHKPFVTTAPCPRVYQGLTFCPAKPFKKNLHCQDSQLVKQLLFSPSFLCFQYTALFAYITLIPCVSPWLRGQYKSKNTAHFHCYPLPSPWAWVWLQMTSAILVCKIWRLILNFKREFLTNVRLLDPRSQVRTSPQALSCFLGKDTSSPLQG